MFCERLNKYMDMLGCSGKEFAEYSGISEATVSRYKSGVRIPMSDSEDMKKLCRGISSAASAKGFDTIVYKNILQELSALAEAEEFDFESLCEKFSMLCNVFSVNIADMSKILK